MARSKSRQTKSMAAVDIAPACARDLPLPFVEYSSQDYLAFMGTREEIVSRLSGVPENHRAIVVSFPDDARFKVYGLILWHLVKMLPEVVERIRRRQIEVFEQLVDELMLESPAGRPPNRRSLRKNTRFEPSGDGGGTRKSGSKARTQEGV